MPKQVLSGGAALEAKLREMARKLKTGGTLQVGFMEGATYPNGTPVAYVAAIQEFGYAKGGIPSRPFFRTMIAQKSPAWGAALGNLIVSHGFEGAGALGAMGEGIRGQLQTSIRDWTDPPNAPGTIAAKGFDKPLLDTGHMVNSVTYSVDL